MAASRRRIRPDARASPMAPTPTIATWIRSPTAAIVRHEQVPRAPVRQFRRERISSTTVATAAGLYPPGMIRSAYRIDGWTNSMCIGRTVAKY